jgi:hypothetical protein
MNAMVLESTTSVTRQKRLRVLCHDVLQQIPTKRGVDALYPKKIISGPL